MRSAAESGGTWKPVISALLAILVGIGLSRFAYSPLIPAIIEARWFSPGEAAYLGAANLAGYLIGALGGRRLGAWSTPNRALQSLMVIASLAFFASALPVSFGWYFAWRLVSGVSGGALMVLGPPTVLATIPGHRRGIAAGVVFAGVGLGIVASGTLVPALLVHGLPATWLVLGAISFAATAAAWFWWPAAGHRNATAPVSPIDAAKLREPALLAIYASYGLIAVGLVPHMVFLVDFVARGLGEGIAIGGRYWVLFGIGALLGPIAAGRLADQMGFDNALRTVLVLHMPCAAVIAFDQSAIALIASSTAVGSAVSGTVPLVLGQTQQRIPSPELQKTAWGIATTVFALGQAASGYAFSHLFAITDGDFELLFLLGSGALLFALLVNSLAALVPTERTRQAAE